MLVPSCSWVWVLSLCDRDLTILELVYIQDGLWQQQASAGALNEGA